jgi:hypothetical protein
VASTPPDLEAERHGDVRTTADLCALLRPDTDQEEVEP